MLEWLEASILAVSIRKSTWAYPILEIIHITGIVLLAGAAMMFDLRLLGLSKRLPVSMLAGHLLPWSRIGLFILIIPSGFLLFITNATTLAADPVFWIKMSLLVTAILNAIFFHRVVWHSIANWNEQASTPLSVKAVACFSILLWISVIACGRLLAY
jgi:hypothetical protein